MGTVLLDVTMSLDGFIAGPGDEVDRLHQWLYELDTWRALHGLAGGESRPSSEVLEETLASTGAIVMGRRTFALGEEPWGENPPFHMPVFVLAHEPREPIANEAGTTFTFVADGVESALEQDRVAAGDKDVAVTGASTARQFLAAPASSTTSRFTSCRCCSAPESACSAISPGRSSPRRWG